nr:hypothetical protein [Mesorhizobium sp. Z1-4]
MWHRPRIAVALSVMLALCACTGSAVEPSSLQPLTSESGQNTSGQLASPAGTQTESTLFSNSSVAATPSRVAAINSSARIQFAPAIGVSAEAVPPLAARLRARAAQRGVTVAGAGGPSATHVLKGYFSAFSDKGETTVIYVWDVLDPAGNRVHRIQGQQKDAGKGDGWAAVTTPTMEAIADRTIDELALWLSSAAG